MTFIGPNRTIVLIIPLPFEGPFILQSGCLGSDVRLHGTLRNIINGIRFYLTTPGPSYFENSQARLPDILTLQFPKYPKMDGIHKRQADISPQPPWLMVYAKSEKEKSQSGCK
jgi:hypothetical protein